MSSRERALEELVDYGVRDAKGALDHLTTAGLRVVEIDPDRALEEQRADRVRAWLTTDDPWNTVEALVEELDALAAVRVDARAAEAEEAITFLREGLGSIAELKLPISVAAYALGLVRAFASVYAPRPVQKRAARHALAYAERATRQSDGAAPAPVREEVVQLSGSGPVGPSPEQGGDVAPVKANDPEVVPLPGDRVDGDGLVWRQEAAGCWHMAAVTEQDGTCRSYCGSTIEQAEQYHGRLREVSP